MKYKIVYRPLVKEDLQNAVDYYKDISPKWLKNFFIELKKPKIIF